MNEVHNGRNTGQNPVRILAVFMGMEGVKETVPAPPHNVDVQLPSGAGNGAQIAGHGRILCAQLVEIADLHIRRHHARPLGAGAEEPPFPDQPCGVERIAWDQQLHPMPAAQVRSDDDALGRTAGSNRMTSIGSPR